MLLIKICFIAYNYKKFNVKALTQQHFVDSCSNHFNNATWILLHLLIAKP